MFLYSLCPPAWLSVCLHICMYVRIPFSCLYYAYKSNLTNDFYGDIRIVQNSIRKLYVGHQTRSQPNPQWGKDRRQGAVGCCQKNPWVEDTNEGEIIPKSIRNSHK